MILLIDNFDSFVFNLARYFQEIGAEARVVRNDAISVEGIRSLRPRALVLSPGPCDPSRAGICMAAVEQLGGEIPILGVCLGHQAIAAALGGRVVRGQPVHGQTGLVIHDGAGIFSGIPSPLRAARYHSLVVESGTLPEALRVAAWLDDGTIMAIRHESLPIVGIQFHPESILTEHGHALLQNFLDAEARASPHVSGAPVSAINGSQTP